MSFRCLLIDFVSYNCKCRVLYILYSLLMPHMNFFFKTLCVQIGTLKIRPIHFFSHKCIIVNCLWHSEHWTQFNIYHRSITVDEKHTIIPSKDCKRINFTLKRSTKIIEITNVYTYHSEPFFQIKLSMRRLNWYNIFICLRNAWPRHQNLITWRGEKQVFFVFFYSYSGQDNLFMKMN